MSLLDFIGSFIVRIPWTPPACLPEPPHDACFPAGWIGI